MKSLNKYIIGFIVFFSILGITRNAFAQEEEEEKTRILFIFDASQSMNANWGSQSRMTIAKTILSEIVDTLKRFKNVEMALRVYGHQYSHTLNNCKDTRLEVPFSSTNAGQIKNKLADIRAKGITPIAYSIERAEKDFPHDPNSQNIVILITDGEESCDGDPCAISAAIQSRGLILKPFVIGLGQSLDLRKKMDCVGAYYEAGSPNDLKVILQNILKKVLDQTSTQVELLDIYRKATETDVNMTFYNPVSKVSQYNYYHTFNSYGKPDTIDVDPINTYDLIIHTIPSIEVEQVNIEANKHNILKVPAAQGHLKLVMQTTESGFYGQKIKCLVKQHKNPGTLNVQSLNSTEKYLTGSYDIEILTLPRIKIDNVAVDQSKTTTIQIPEPGLITIYSTIELYGGIFVMENGKLNKIYSLNDRILKETIALQPGNYTVIYRTKLMRDSNLTISKQFKVTSGESATIKL